MYRNLLFVSFTLLWAGHACCQTSNYRPKLAEFGVETLRGYGVRSSSESFGSNSDKVDQDRLIKAKLGIPIFMKKDRLLGVQLKYYQHRFDFAQEGLSVNDALFEHLDNRKFISTGIRFFYQQDVKENQQFQIIGGTELKGDEFHWNRNTTKHFIGGTYTWRPEAGTKFGTGFVVNRVMGRTAVYPLLLFEKELTDRWALNLTLPRSASLRYNWNERNFLIATTELRGWRYNLTETPVSDQRNLMLRRVDWQFSLSWEHEIHDWLWFGVDVGYNKNLQYFLASPGDRAREALIELNSQEAAYGEVSLFIVPPRKFFR